MSTREFDRANMVVVARDAQAESGEAPAGDRASPVRLRALVEAHYDFVWRSVRHLGVEEAHAEDAAQKVMCILARRLGEITPGAEMSFLFSTAMRVASEARRAARRRPATDGCDVDTFAGSMPSPEDLVDARAARSVLARVLEAIPLEMRIVFVLVEIEELTVAEAARVARIPAGTAASRLRRGRERFHEIVRRMQAREGHGRDERGGKR